MEDIVFLRTAGDKVFLLLISSVNICLIVHQDGEKKENYPKILTVSLINLSFLPHSLSLSLSLSLSPYTLLGFYCFKLNFNVSNFLTVVSIFYYIVSQLFVFFFVFAVFFTASYYFLLCAVSYCLASFLSFSACFFCFMLFLTVFSGFFLQFISFQTFFCFIFSYCFFYFFNFLDFSKLFYPFLLPLSHGF